MNLHHLAGWWQHLYLACFIAAICAMALGNGWLAAGLFIFGLAAGLAVDSRPAPRISQLRRRQLDDIAERDRHQVVFPATKPRPHG